MNQQAAEGGLKPAGFINKAIYPIGVGSKYSEDFYDVKSGDNETTSSPNLFTAVAGYDLATGWGSSNGQSLINDLAGISETAEPQETNCVVTYQNGVLTYTITVQDSTPNATVWYTVYSNGTFLTQGSVSAGGNFQVSGGGSMTGTMYATAPGYVKSESTGLSF